MSFQSISSSDLSNSNEQSFIQTDQEIIIQNSNILKHNNKQSNNCLKHPNKKAKFYVQQNSNQLFCSKCALNLALQGLKIEETQEMQLEIQRKDKINNFQKDLHQVLQQCDQKLINLNDIKKNLIHQWEEQNINCDEFFYLIQKTTNQLKQTYQEKLQNDYIIYQNQVQEQIENIKLLIQQLKQFSIDIFTNHDNIVKKMEMKPFDDIMQKYQKKVDEIRYQQFNNQFQLSLKQLNVDQNQILTFMNKMCYNLLIKNDNMEYNQKNQQNFEFNLSNNQNYIEIIENEEIHNPIIQQSSISQHFNKFESINSNPTRSNANTPESWKQKNSLRRDNITPNDKISYQNSSRILEQVSSKKTLQKQLIEKYSYKYNEKQKTTTDYERISEKSYSLLNNNLSCLQLQKFIKEAERGSLEDRELTPKHKVIPITKSIVQGQNYYNQIKYNSNQKSQQNLIQNNINKLQYGSVPNLKSAFHLQQQSDPVYLHRQQEGHLRSKSKQIKPQSIEQESKRQFIMNVGINQIPQAHNENTLKDKILKELCSHPNEQVQSQIIKNHQQKQKNQKTKNKENFELTSQKNKRIGQNINKKQQQ